MTEKTEKQSKPDDNEKPPAGASGVVSKLSENATLIACLVVCVWLVMTFVLLGRVDAKDAEWVRMHALLTSLESVAFAAAGALFGTTIQARRVQDAKDETANAKGEAKTARKDAADNAVAASNGKALAEMVKAKVPKALSRESLNLLHQDLDLAPRGEPLIFGDDLAELRQVAEKLFPG